jgi:asparagine synthase (glutamine-hydrolysing)
MCGLSGIFNRSGQPVSLQEIKQVNQILAHRGPDSEGYFLDNNIALGHKRLAILDTSANGSQPMTSKNGEWTIVFNGCIYNFLELKQELKNKGHFFVSQTDTEVIVEGFAEYGTEFVKRFNGMFAIAAWNKKEHALYLIRDRYGVKPLYYWYNGETLVFASEIKAILQHKLVTVDVDYGALNEYFTFQNLFTYRTLFKGICMLPPANNIRIDRSTKAIIHNSWWDFDFTKPDNSMTFEDSVSETERLFRQAVSRQMIADVPVGSYLSGGMDSGSITAVAASHVNRLTTFTCGFDMSEITGVEVNYDERRDAELMANFFKTEHYEQVINAGDLSWSLPRVVWHLEDLRVGMSYPNYYISRLASKFVKVCLQGTGGDELFGGYPWRYYRIFKSLDRKDFFDQYYQFWQRLVPDEQKDSLFVDPVKQKINKDEPRTVFERVFIFNPNLRYSSPEEHIQNSLYFEIKTFLHGLLIVGDKLSMANGLEERFPFLDNDLVEFAEKIPVRHKLGNLENMKKIDENNARRRFQVYREFHDGKTVLRKAMSDFIPEKILNRQKQGFSAPDESWYRGENANYLKELLLNKSTVSTEFISKKYIEQIVDEHLNKKINHRLLLWSFMNFEWWCRIFLHNERI